jgi:inner membrane protein
LDSVSNHEDLQKLIRFSKNYYTIEKWSDTIVFNDLRFGQILGWKSPSNKFVFHYFLEHPKDNRLVVQRGRFAGWNWIFFQSMLSRIAGN